MFTDFFTPGVYAVDPVIFSIPHMMAIGAMVLLVGLLYLNRRKNYMEKTVKPLLLALLIISEVSFMTWTLSTGIWDLRYHLPLQLCTISLFICIIMLWTENRWLVEVVYFFGIAGALQAIITPDLYYTFTHFRYWHFFVAHIAIILSILYMIWVKNIRLTLKSLVHSFIALNVIALIVFSINVTTGANYMFLSEKPAGGSILDFLSPYPWYILELQLVALVMYLLLYLPFHLTNDKHKNKEKQGAT